MYNAFRPICHTIVTLYFGRDLAILTVLHVSHAAVHFLRLLDDVPSGGLATRLDSDASRTEESTFLTASLRM